jgi:hypothetical protein
MNVSRDLLNAYWRIISHRGPAGLLLFGLAIAMPAPTQAPPSPSYAFSSGAAAPNIPLELVADGLVFVRAKVNDRPGWFIVDNATQGFTVDREFAHRISLQTSSGSAARGGGPAEIQTEVARDVRISLPGLDLTHRNLVVIPLKILEPTIGHEVDGILGSRLFDDFVVALDYERHRLSVYSLKQYRLSGQETELPISIDAHGFQFVEARLDLPGVEPIHATFLIDGGANTYADIYKPFADARHLPPPAMQLLDEPGSSTGGTTQSREGRADRIGIGPYSVKHPPITFAQDTEGLMAAKDYAGLVGTEFLERFTVVFDNPGKRLLLTPNRHYGDIVEYDESGLRIRAEGRDFRDFAVTRIVPRSPAAEAGIEPGDVLESMDGRSASQFTLTEIRSMLCRPNARYAIGIKRGNGHLRWVLTLRPLL